MRRVEIQSRMDITLLALAYMERLITRAKEGEIFYEKDKNSEIKYLYFDNDYYNSILCKEINNPVFIEKINRSNAAFDWNALRKTLLNSLEIDNVDSVNLEYYSLVDKSATSNPVSYSEDLLNKLLKTYDDSPDIGTWQKLENDLKKLFPLIHSMDVFRQDGILRIFFYIPLQLESKLKFVLEPIHLLLKKYNLGVSNITRHENESQGNLYISIFLEE